MQNEAVRLCHHFPSHMSDGTGTGTGPVLVDATLRKVEVADFAISTFSVVYGVLFFLFCFIPPCYIYKHIVTCSMQYKCVF